MSETYTKLFGSITDSTIWAEDNDTRIMWITMLAMADRNGYVGASVPGLAARARVPLESAERALEKFLGPDPYSRSPDFEGRRIEVADRGWNLLNYDRFRDMRDEEARKEYERNRKREQRKKKPAVVSGTNGDSPALSQVVAPVPPLSAQAEAEAEADPPLSPPRGATYSTAFVEFWKAYPRKTGKDAAWRAWKRAKPVAKDVMVALEWQRRSPDWKKDNGEFVPHPSTYLNQGRWKDDPPRSAMKPTRNTELTFLSPFRDDDGNR